MSSTIHVLHVDDDPSLGELVATFLEREDDRFAVETVTSAAEGLDIIRDRPPDCIVSDYDMPGQNGIEFLQSVRDEWPNVPFILFTGKGSEEVASDAISNGATDYLQKGSGTDQYELLANRIGNAVEQDRSTRRAANLERIRQLTYDVNQAMVRATSPEEIERQVCQLIADSDPYVTACIADVDRETMKIEPRTWGGDAAGYFEELDMIIDEGSPGRHAPGGRAFHDREIAVSQNIKEDDQYARWREPALQRGFRSLAVVPIEYEGELHGLLATFASRPNAFDQTERDLLVELANDIGHALHGLYLQTELERQNDLFNQAQEIATVGAWEYNMQEERTIWTDYVYEIHDRPKDSAPDRQDILELYHPDDRATLREAFHDAVETGEPFDLELRLLTSDGETRWVRARAQPQREDGELVRIRGTIQDITDRKQRQQDLEKNERRYQSILGDPRFLAGILDTDGTLLDANHTAMEYIDADLEDVVGEPFSETPWWPEDLQSVVREKIEQAASGEYVTYEADLTTPDGDPYSVTDVIRPVTDDDEQIVSLVVSARDITERKEREQRLERYERLVEHLPVGVFRTNANGDFLSMNEALVEIFDAESREHLHSVGARSLYADEEDRQQLLEQLQSEGIVDDELLRMETVPGDTVWVRVTLRLVEEDGEHYLDGIASDVTDRRELTRRRERAETIFEHTQDALFLIDVGEGQKFTIRSVNRAYEEMTGRSLDELKGRTPRELLGDDQGAEVEAHFKECVEKREPIEYDEQLTLGQTTKDWHTRLAPVTEDDRVVQLVGATRDITDQRERQRRYEAIFNQTYQFTGLLEPDGTLIEANETALAFGGLDPDDVLGKKMWEAYWFQHSEETTERARESVERAADGEFVRDELPVQGTDDREAIIDFSVRPLRDEQGEISLLIPEGRDITEKKRREQELQEENERFRSVFEKAFDAMVIADDEGTFVDANESAAELFGLPEEELLGRSIEEFAPEDFDFRAAWREFQASNRDRGEFPLVRPDGTERTVEYAATRNIIPGQHLSVLRDVTVQKHREARLEALNETAQKLMTADTPAEVAEVGVTAAREVLNLKVNGIHFYDDEQAGLVPVAQTEESKNLVGEAPTFTEGDSIAWRVYESGEPLALDDVRDNPDVHNPDTPVRSELYLPIGEYGVLLNASEEPEAFDREDIVLGELLAGTIATALEQIERTEQLRTRERNLERQNERLEEFASVVSHDLRNPLRTAEGNLELLNEDCDSDRIEALDHSLTRMDDLIEDLLTLAREGNAVGEFESVNLRNAVETCWQSVDTADATLAIEVERTIRADRSRLQQLLENLVRNAVEHGSDDVTIVVGGLADGFYIEDDGSGIPEDDRDGVFDAGYSTSDEGTGFGLSIVKQIADAHGWEIRVTGGSDGGARFEITDVEFVAE